LRRLARAREALCDEFAEALRIEQLAREAGLSEKHFRRLFAQTYGDTPGRFLAQVRIGRAKELLARGASVTEACVGVGFSSVFETRDCRKTYAELKARGVIFRSDRRSACTASKPCSETTRAIGSV
jgi:AraC-like DNA-binding protein